MIGVSQSPLSKSQKRMVSAVLRSEPLESPIIRKRKVPLNDTDSYSSPVSSSKKIKNTTTSPRKRKSSKEMTSSSKKSKEVPEVRRTYAATPLPRKKRVSLKKVDNDAATPLPRKKRVSRKKVDNDMLVDIFGSSASGVIRK